MHQNRHKATVKSPSAFISLSLVQVVAPKQESLDKAEAELRAQMATLHQKQAELKEVTDKLQALQDNLITKQKEKKVHTPYSLPSSFSASRFTCQCRP